ERRAAHLAELAVRVGAPPDRDRSVDELQQREHEEREEARGQDELEQREAVAAMAGRRVQHRKNRGGAEGDGPRKLEAPEAPFSFSALLRVPLRASAVLLGTSALRKASATRHFRAHRSTLANVRFGPMYSTPKSSSRGVAFQPCASPSVGSNAPG